MLQKHQNYSSIVSKHYKRLFIDKCNWFITHIIKSQVKSEKGLGELVNIHSKTLKESIGNKYNSIINALVDIEIVYINEKYSSGKFTKSYALKKNLDEGDYKMVKDRLIKRVRELYKDVIPKDLNIDKLFKTDKVSVVRWVDYGSEFD